MTGTNDWIGARLAAGRYTIIERIGHGNMGEVYRARDANLGTDVVVKFPVSAGAGESDPDFFARFDREIRSLIRLTHPHVVKVIDVGQHEGRPFVVMQYLEGGSLRDKVEGPGGAPRPVPADSLAGWLPEVARALDFIHAQGFVHRDVKPANILFDVHGNAYLGDFGIMKALAADPSDRHASGLTAPGFLLATPNYVAPEIVMGGTPGPKIDQYSLAMTVHEVLTGSNVMAGPSPSATVVNQMNLNPPLVHDVIPGVPERLSKAIDRALAKDPDQRFANCVEFAREVLADLPGGSGLVAVTAGATAVAVGEGGPGGAGWTREDPITIYPADEEGQIAASKATMVAPVSKAVGPSGSALAPRPETSTRRAGWSRRWVAGVVLAVAGVVLVGLSLVWHGRNRQVAGTPSAGPAAEAEPVVLNIAYGTEKQAWLEAALASYRTRPEARGVSINLLGMGSMEGARKILEGPGDTPIHVWSPASSAYRDVFEREWRVKHGDRPPILRAENLAMTPMVFVMWKPRYEAFIKNYGAVNFKNIARAVEEPGGWGGIGGAADWGVFKFGHTHPNKSNSGLLALALMAYEFTGKQRGLTPGDVTDPAFQKWFRALERGVTRHGGGLTSSTGTLMKEMVLRGPSQYDCLVLYENLAIDYVATAREHWDDLQVAYPEPNLWNEHPYYILDVPWCHKAEREAAARFLDYLLSEPVQRQALAHGFRPGNPAVPVRLTDSPLVRCERFGVRLSPPAMAEPPRAEVVDNLLSSFQRVEP